MSISLRDPMRPTLTLHKDGKVIHTFSWKEPGVMDSSGTLDGAFWHQPPRHSVITRTEAELGYAAAFAPRYEATDTLKAIRYAWRQSL